MLAGKTMSFLLSTFQEFDTVNNYANMHISCSWETAPKHIGVVSLGKIQMAQDAKNVS